MKMPLLGNRARLAAAGLLLAMPSTRAWPAWFHKKSAALDQLGQMAGRNGAVVPPDVAISLSDVLDQESNLDHWDHPSICRRTKEIPGSYSDVRASDLERFAPYLYLSSFLMMRGAKSRAENLKGTWKAVRRVRFSYKQLEASPDPVACLGYNVATNPDGVMYDMDVYIGSGRAPMPKLEFGDRSASFKDDGLHDFAEEPVGYEETADAIRLTIHPTFFDAYNKTSIWMCRMFPGSDDRLICETTGNHIFIPHFLIWARDDDDPLGGLEGALGRFAPKPLTDIQLIRPKPKH